MALANIGARMIQSLAPSLGATAADMTSKEACKPLAQGLVPDMLKLQQKAIADADPSGLAFIADQTAALRASDPKALKGKLDNMAKSAARYFTGMPELPAYDMRTVATQGAGVTGITGDMHIKNAGTMLTAKGEVKRRFNDFDEATIAPAALDYNHEATDLVLVGIEKKLPADKTKALVTSFAGSYYDTMAALAKKPGAKVKVASPEIVQAQVKHAQSRTYDKWISTHTDMRFGNRMLPRNGWNRNVDANVRPAVTQTVNSYIATLPAEQRQALAAMKITDMTQVFSGTGSAGEKRFHVQLEGGKGVAPVLLQFKEQAPAALDQFVTPRIKFTSHAQRNVAISNLMDGNLDPFRGSARMPDGSDMLVERLDPGHTILDVDRLSYGDLNDLVKFDAAQGAKGHARGALAGLAGAPEILSTLGTREQFVNGVVSTATDYADVVVKRHAALVAALKKDPTLATFATAAAAK